MTANLNCGDTATIEAEGPDAEEAVKRLARVTGESKKKDSGSTSSSRWRADANLGLP
jgi:PTS HPr component family protein